MLSLSVSSFSISLLRLKHNRDDASCYFSTEISNTEDNLAATFCFFEVSLPRITLGPVHTKTIVNANASKRKLFYGFRPSVHTKTMKTLTVNA